MGLRNVVFLSCMSPGSMRISAKIRFRIEPITDHFMPGKKTGSLYMIPVPLAEASVDTIPARNIELIHQLRIFIAEKARTCRRYIKTTDPPYAISDLDVRELPRKNEQVPLESLLKPLLEGESVGFMSEAGSPGIADPGTRITAFCHRHGIPVVPHVGPSSIMLALMASGLNGQQFCFHGYLPPKKDALKKRLLQLEQQVQRSGETQIFIETPYRNLQMIECALINLHAHTKFCIAADLTGKKEWIKMAPVKDWKSIQIPNLHKVPAIYLMGR